MEENQTEQAQEQVSEPTFPKEEVSFPSVGSPQKQGGAKTLLIVGILILVGILGFVIYKSASSSNEEITVEPTPFENLATPSGEESATPTATPAADREEVSIQIQNGTGIAGEAAYLQTQLAALGYKDIKVGNASSQNATATEVTFAKSLDASIVSEITQKLKSIYTEVKTTTSSSTTTFDVVIITGLKKGATPKPSATPAATSTPKATVSPTPTSTP
ncbi:MAG TPA: LytR C-terminal domain-containing protein [Patescibacteria group bacterium]|nr:LytR C-terminal domain-containing protein [Patescibacteria group bacterium]